MAVHERSSKWDYRNWRYSVNGDEHRVNANTRIWETAEEKARDLEEQLGRANRANQSRQMPSGQRLSLYDWGCGV